jgi:hypothetical protein
MGRKFMTSQLYVSRFEAYIFSDYHEARWKVSDQRKDSIDLQEAMRWMHKSEELVMELARNNQSLFETLGMIRTLFPHTPRLEELTSRVYHFKTPRTSSPPNGKDLIELNAWKEQSVKSLQELVEREYAKPIDELLDYLAIEIAREASSL